MVRVALVSAYSRLSAPNETKTRPTDWPAQGRHRRSIFEIADMEIGIKMDGYWGSYRTADEESMQSTRLESIGLTSGGRLDFSGPFGRAFRAEMPGVWGTHVGIVGRLGYRWTNNAAVF